MKQNEINFACFWLCHYCLMPLIFFSLKLHGETPNSGAETTFRVAQLWSNACLRKPLQIKRSLNSIRTKSDFVPNPEVRIYTLRPRCKSTSLSDGLINNNPNAVDKLSLPAVIYESSSLKCKCWPRVTRFKSCTPTFNQSVQNGTHDCT